MEEIITYIKNKITGDRIENSLQHNKIQGLRIGITFFWGESFKSLWSNGAGQNMYFLKQCLEAIDEVEEVYFVYWRADVSLLSDALRMKHLPVAIYEYTDVLSRTDILIEGTLTLEPEYEQQFREHGAKIVSYRMGNDFITDMEKFVNDKDGGRAFNGTRYDAIWVIPQFYESNKSYLEIISGAPVYEVPHIWSPVLMEELLEEFQDSHVFGYVPNKVPRKRVAVMEPNISVGKTCMTPVLVTEELYKRNPSLLEHVYLCNTYDKKDLNGFFNFIGYTSLVKDGVMSVETRHLTPLFLSEYADILLSHQWEWGLNYVYYEALYGNYPLVHNSPFLRKANVGFYYEGFNAYEGAEALCRAIYTYDYEFDYYQEKNKHFIDSLSPTTLDNILLHRRLILKLYE